LISLMGSITMPSFIINLFLICRRLQAKKHLLDNGVPYHRCVRLWTV